MSLLTYISALLLVFFNTSAVSAAEEDLRTTPPTPSPFGTLSDERNQSRTVLDMHGRSTDDYKRTLEEYRSLDADYRRSYGAQRTALQEQALARAKDVLLSKLGAVETHFKNLTQRLETLNLLTDADGENLNSQLGIYQTFMEESKTKIENATTIEELRVISLELNTRSLSSLGFVNYYTVKLSIQKGLAIIESIMSKADLIQAHIDASGELGGNIAGIQAALDSAMLSLENSKSSYETIQSGLNTISPSNTPAVEAQFQAVRKTNSDVAAAHASVKQVIRNLRTLFGQSPWVIDRSKFMEEN